MKNVPTTKVSDERGLKSLNRGFQKALNTGLRFMEKDKCRSWRKSVGGSKMKLKEGL
jgi:hypothetical protein